MTPLLALLALAAQAAHEDPHPPVETRSVDVYTSATAEGMMPGGQMSVSLRKSLPKSGCDPVPGEEELAKYPPDVRAKAQNLKCDTSPQAANPRRQGPRYRYDNWIVSAANAWGVDPGFLKARIHIEASFDPLQENGGELRAKRRSASCQPGSARSDYCWGKGLSMMGRADAKRFNLDWDAPKPKNEAELAKMCAPFVLGQPWPKPLAPIWCPGPAIFAMARFTREIFDQAHYITLRDKNGLPKKPPRFIRADPLYRKSTDEVYRMLAGSYNRGEMPFNSIEEHYRQTGQLPANYAVAWQVCRINPDSAEARKMGTTPETKSNNDNRTSVPYPILEREFKNRCDVYKIARLCGDEGEGWAFEYGRDFEVEEPKGTEDNDRRVWKVKEPTA